MDYQFLSLQQYLQVVASLFFLFPFCLQNFLILFCSHIQMSLIQQHIFIYICMDVKYTYIYKNKIMQVQEISTTFACEVPTLFLLMFLRPFLAQSLLACSLQINLTSIVSWSSIPLLMKMGCHRVRQGCL